LIGLVALGSSAALAQKPGSEELNIVKWGGAKTEGLDVGPDGRIVLAGRFQGYPNHPWVRAYLPDGRLDPLFGEEGQVWLGADWRRIVGTLVQPDGRILVAQRSDAYSRRDEPDIVRRLNPDGTPDTTFDGDGTLQPLLGPRSRPTDIALQPDGRVIVVGTETNYSPAPWTTVVVTRYLPDGAPDSSFGSNGSTEFSGPFETAGAVAVQPGGGLVVTARGTDGRLAIARLSGDGRLDPSFGAGVVAPARFGNSSWAQPLLFGGAPRPVITEGGAMRVPITVARGGRPPFRMALLGLTPNGQPDLGFGRQGLAVGPPPPSRYDETGAYAISDPSGSIIVVGRRRAQDEFLRQDERDVLRRFRSDGTLDRSFGDRGVVRGRLPGGGYDVIDQRVAFLDADTLVSSEYSYDGKYGSWGAATLRTLHGGYDHDPPSISLDVRGCRRAAVRIADLSGMDKVVARVNRRIVRITAQMRFLVRAGRGGERVTVKAIDLAGNSAASAVRLPRC
jgi:uncharacterized delta-60 repeat protein